VCLGREREYVSFILIHMHGHMHIHMPYAHLLSSCVCVDSRSDFRAGSSGGYQGVNAEDADHTSEYGLGDEIEGGI
jgi:hypothetical protein